MSVNQVRGSTNFWVGDHQAVYKVDGDKKTVTRDKGATFVANSADTLETGVRAILPNGIATQPVEGIIRGWNATDIAVLKPFTALAGLLVGIVIGVFRDLYDIGVFLVSFFKNLIDVIIMAFKSDEVTKEDLGIDQEEMDELKKGKVGWSFTPYPTQTVVEGGKAYEVENNGMHVPKKNALEKAGAYMGFTFVVADD